MEVSETTVRLFLLLVAQEGINGAQELMRLSGISDEEIFEITRETNAFVFANSDDLAVIMAGGGENVTSPDYVWVRDRRDGYQFLIRRDSDLFDKNDNLEVI